MITNTTHELIETLTREAALFEEFLDLLDQQRDALVAGEVAALSEITVAQREKLTESRVLDERRRRLVERLAADNSIVGDVTVTKLLELVSDDHGRKLSELRDTILDLNERIDEARGRNTVLLNKSRELVSETLRIINRLGSPDAKGSGYTRGAEPVEAGNKQPRVSLALDRRV